MGRNFHDWISFTFRLQDGSYTGTGGAPYQFFILQTKSVDRQFIPRRVLRLFDACLLLGVAGMMLAELHALPFFSVAGLRSAESGCSKCAEHLLRA